MTYFSLSLTVNYCFLFRQNGDIHFIGIFFGTKSSSVSGSITFAIEFGGANEVDGGLTIVWEIVGPYASIADGRYGTIQVKFERQNICA